MQQSVTLLTYDDYLTLPNDGKRYELIEGELFMTPAPTTEHQDISFRLERLLYEFVLKSNRGHIYHAPVDVVFSMTDVVEPDIIYISKEREHIITKRNIIAAPDLVVEILSEGTETIDRTAKKALYEKYGVMEYWIVDPDGKTLECFVLKEGKSVLFGSFCINDMFESTLLKGFRVNLKEVFG
jgi:Uma2 family endonuclease